MQWDLGKKYDDISPMNPVGDGDIYSESAQIVIEDGQTNPPSLDNFIWNPEECELLLREMKKADVDFQITNKFGNNLLDIAAAFPSHFHVEKTEKEMIQSLTRKEYINFWKFQIRIIGLRLLRPYFLIETNLRLC